MAQNVIIINVANITATLKTSSILTVPIEPTVALAEVLRLQSIAI